MILQEESLELALAMYLANRKPTQLSGVFFDGPNGPNFELFSCTMLSIAF